MTEDIDRLVEASIRKRCAAELLLANGHDAEGVVLAKDGFRLALQALQTKAGDEDWKTFLTGAAIKEKRRQLVERAAENIDAPPNTDVPYIAAQRVIVGVLLPNRRSMPWRLLSSVIGVGAVIATSFGVYAASKPPRGKVIPRASGRWSNAFLPKKAVDGSTHTNWLLPDKKTGWLSLNLDPPRAVETFELMNARNVPYLDRASSRFRVSFYSSGRSVHKVEGEFTDISEDEDWRTFEVNLERVDRIQIQVLGYHGAGAGIAEVRVN